MRVTTTADLDDTKLYYLASPYTAPSTLSKRHQHQLMLSRWREVTELATKLIFYYDLDLILPITTSKVLKDHEPRLGTHWEYWKKTDTNLVLHSDGLIVAMMPGWKESIGVQAEIAIAKKVRKPVYYIDPITLMLVSEKNSALHNTGR